ncbi:MAG: ATP synthase F1 subunit epsilon [Solobacterium sp.]|nr:ATP synthase F1 subunit epsilon [Solobacterium sp.]MBQ6505796.1 ATP synthase F1 subunit epsilon [Clostridia bacterium]MBQ6531521.1 ATP synthase F1 subunit epsilon [Solobacterium sp.]MBR0213493.1 ATP synthase F1 subunit epsilon [Solobacterium sp.]
MMIEVRIVTPQGMYKTFETSILNVDTIDGQRGILPNHVPVVTMLKTGVLNVVENGTDRNYYAVDGGLLYYRDNKAELLVDDILHSSEIDVERQRAGIEKGNEMLRTMTDEAGAEEIRKRIRIRENRIKVAGMK